MLFPPWLNDLRARWQRSRTRKTGQSGRARHRSARLALERLEDRTLPSAPTPKFDWSMPDHFGLDQKTVKYSPVTGELRLTAGSDGLIDYPYERDANGIVDNRPGHVAQNYVNPPGYKVHLDGSFTIGVMRSKRTAAGSVLIWRRFSRSRFQLRHLFPTPRILGW